MLLQKIIQLLVHYAFYANSIDVRFLDAVEVVTKLNGEITIQLRSENGIIKLRTYANITDLLASYKSVLHSYRNRSFDNSIRCAQVDQLILLLNGSGKNRDVDIMENGTIPFELYLTKILRTVDYDGDYPPSYGA